MKQNRILALLTVAGLCISGAATVYAAEDTAPTTTDVQYPVGTLHDFIVSSSTSYTTTTDPFGNTAPLATDSDTSETVPILTDVTTSPYYPEYNPWYTDPETGNTYYMGTNAYRETRLEIVEYPRTEFLLGEPLNTDGLKVFMIEQRNYNQKDYDVSNLLNIETDYDPNTSGTYTVYVSTDYTNGEAATDVILSYEVTVLECVYTVTTTSATQLGSTPTSATSGISSTTTGISTTTSASIDNMLQKAGDVNGDAYLKVNDVILLNRYIAEDPTMQEATRTAAFLIRNADYNGDGSINSDDSSALLLCIAGLTKR